MPDKKLHPVMQADALIADAARRAFGDQAKAYFEKATDDVAQNKALREYALREIADLGFCDALESPDNASAWPDAAALIRAQAYSGLPVDMVHILVGQDTAAAIAREAGTYEAAPVPAAVERDLPAGSALFALGRCLQLGSAMEAAIDLSLQYVQDRKQFGRALSAFQAIQHSLAIAAEDLAAATASTDLALSALVTGGQSARFVHLLRSAAVVNAGAVTRVYEVTHLVHGAIGFTSEYALHHHTLDMLQWRNDVQTLLGSEAGCARLLGDQAVAHGGVWAGVTGLMGNPAS